MTQKGGDRGRFIFLVDTALIGCRTNVQKWHLNLEYIQVSCSVSPNRHTARPQVAAHIKNAGEMRRNILRKMEVALE